MARKRKPKGKPTGKPGKRGRVTSPATFKRARAARRNGARGGRPCERPGPGGIPWATVRRYARLGADRDLVVAALGIRPEQLRDPETVARLQEELARGAALHRVDLLVDVDRVRSGGPGKVNAVLASLRQASGWSTTDSGKGGNEKRPDADTAVAEILRMLGRFRGPR